MAVLLIELAGANETQGEYMKLTILLISILIIVSRAFGITGDLDRDGDVDFDDFFLFSDNFGKTGSIDVSDCGDEISTIPLTLTGNGIQTTGKFQLESGLRVIRVTKAIPTESIFVTMLNGDTGDRFSDGSFFDINDLEEISKSFQVDATGAFVINVESGGEWTITLDSGENIPSIPSGDPITLSGNGTQTTGRFALESGLRVIRITKSTATESIFVTMLNADTGDRFSDGSIFDINGLEEISKSFRVESGDVGNYVMNIETGGEWTITIE